MAGSNLDYPQGLMPQRDQHGQTPEEIRWPLKQGIQTTAFATRIYEGQMVQFAATGWVKGLVSAADLTASGPSAGAIYGVAAEPYWGSAASTQTDLAVVPLRRGQRFVCQLNNTTSLANLHSVVQKNVDMTAYDDGNTISGRSIMEANAASLTSASQQFRIVDVLTQDGGKRLGPNAKVVVMPNFGGTALQTDEEIATGAV